MLCFALCQGKRSFLAFLSHGCRAIDDLPVMLYNQSASEQRKICLKEHVKFDP